MRIILYLPSLEEPGEGAPFRTDPEALLSPEGIELRVYNYGFVKNRVAAIRNENGSVSSERLIQNPANVRGKTDY